MKFTLVLAVIASVSAIELNAAKELIPESGIYWDSVHANADAMNAHTLNVANDSLKYQQAGVNASAADIAAYKASHRN